MPLHSREFSGVMLSFSQTWLNRASTLYFAGLGNGDQRTVCYGALRKILSTIFLYGRDCASSFLVTQVLRIYGGPLGVLIARSSRLNFFFKAAVVVVSAAATTVRERATDTCEVDEENTESKVTSITSG